MIETTLVKDCHQAFENIKKDVCSLESVEIEEKLWKSIIKVYKENSDDNIIHYLIGYYITLHEFLSLNASSPDKFSKFYRCGFVLANSNKQLLYNVYIRLGDLYRYVDSREIARHYYQKALLIDPARGTAYNQLTLCTPLTKAYQCIYYAVRACNASICPIANSNVKQSIARIDCPVFERFRLANNVKLSDNPIEISYPETGQEWFYLIVISIHFNDLNLTLNLLLDQILNVTEENLNEYGPKIMEIDYLLMSLEVALDWILKDRLNSNNFPSIENLKLFNSQFKFKVSKFSKIEEKNSIALVHNFMLKDFVPLKSLYDKMEYYYEAETYKVEKHRKILIPRLICKLQNF